MAKSIRSKRKRMFRSIKRNRYAVKEMIKLKKMLGMPVAEEEAAVPPLHVVEYRLKKCSKDEEKPVDPQRNIQFKYTEKGTIIPVVSSDEEEEEKEEEMNEESEGKQTSKEGETEMDHSQKKVFDRLTKKDELGNYPAWFTQKDIKKQAKRMKIRKQKLKAIDKRLNKKISRGKKKKKKRVAEKNNIMEQSNDEKGNMKMELEGIVQNISEQNTTV